MITSLATESYVDGVVEFHQLKGYLGLTAVEARKSPDILEVFDELVDNVATNPELRLSYIGVIRSRGDNRLRAIDQVREIETEIVSLAHDVDAISDRQYETQRVALKDDQEVRKRAEAFIKLFKSVIPQEELPKALQKTRRKPGTKTAPNKPDSTAQESASSDTTTTEQVAVEPAAPKQQVETQRPLRYYETLDAGTEPKTTVESEQEDTLDWQAIRFARAVLSWVVRLERSQPEAGIPWTKLGKVAAENLRIDYEEAKAMLRGFQHAGDLHVVGHQKGVRLLSAVPVEQPEVEVQNPETSNPTIDEAIYDAEAQEDIVRTIVLELLKRDFQKGIKIKSLWSEKPELEPIVKDTISKLRKTGHIESYQPKLQSSPHAKRNTEPFIRFTNSDIWRACKADVRALLDDLDSSS